MKSKTYWESNPMEKQKLITVAISDSDYYQSNYIHPEDMEGLVKLGVRFPELEKEFAFHDELQRLYRNLKIVTV